MLGLAACQNEPEGLDVNVGGEQAVTINVTVPETETRAGGLNSALGVFDNGVLDGAATMRYILKIYDATGAASHDRQVAYSDGKKVAFDVRLVPDRDYTFVVWADVVTAEADVDNHYDTSDLTNVTLKGEWAAMDETRDAFTGTLLVKDFNGSKGITVNLTRPFAKLRVITTDMVALNNLGIVPTTATVEYKVQHYNAFNALAGSVIGDSKNRNIKHENFSIKSYGEDVQNGADMTLFTDYFFAKEGDVVKFEFNVYDQNNDLIKFNNFNTDIAVNRNYLTTIKGNVLTDSNNIKVEVENGGEFGGNENWPDENAEQLAYAAMFGGEVTLTEDVALTQPLEIAEGANVVINLGDKTITGTFAKGSGAIIENNGILTIAGGTLENTTENGDAVINNTGELVLEGVKIKGAPIGTTDYPNYAVYTSGKLTVENETQIISDRGALNMQNGADVTINGGEFVVTDNIGTRVLTAHVIYASGYSSKLTINDGNFEMNIGNGGGTSVICPAGATIKVYGGNFYHKPVTDVQSGCFQNYMGYGAPVDVYGGAFNDDTVTKSGNLAAGYKAIAAGGIYYVLPETIANAAEAEGVTAVTESTTDVAAALATNNGEATLFMWNDVAYIAKYGEVVITSAADEATTVRGVVEYSTGLTSATVAEGIEVVGNRTFRKCTNLDTVALPNTLTEIGPAVFQSCSNLANITIPESVTTIGEGAFAECTALTSINIPAGITRLEKDVLRNTGLVSIEIPASVNYIGAQAFRDCESLTEVKILSPEFTIENNTFTNMAAPVPTMSIHVVNAEMEAYLNSVLSNYDKSYITVVGPKSVSNSNDLNKEVNKKNATVNVAAGEYTFPSSVAAGVTIKCEEGTVFAGTSSLNIKGATVTGATFKNENGVAVSGTVYGEFKNCTFEGSEALRWCYATAGETTIFENCVIKTDFRGFHYDGLAGTVIFRNCEINGFNAYGGNGKVIFEGCIFGCDQSSYNGLNIYSDTDLVNCTFNFVSGKINFVDLEEVGKTLTITNCTATLDGNPANIADYVGGSKKGECTVVIQ